MRMSLFRRSITDATFSIREISERAAQHDDAVRFDIGQPDFDTPQVVKEAVKERIDEEQVSYTPLWGIPELRDVIADRASTKLDAARENVLVTTGGTGALYCICTAILDPGDTVLTNDPAWPPYSMITAATPGEQRQVPYIADDGTVNQTGITDAIDDTTKLLILNTPENPTGRVYTAEQVETIGEIAEDHDLYIVADEVYDRLLYDGTHVSPAELFPDRTLVVNSVSKNFAMTGWRLGWIVAEDADVIHELGKVNRATTACPNFPAQQAALIALEEAQGYAAEMRDTYRERRDLVMDRINALGWNCPQPDGAIYAFPDVGRDSWDFAHELLDATGVAVVPGEPHGSASDTHVRLCFGSADMDALEEGFDRIERFVDGHRDI